MEEWILLVIPTYGWCLDLGVRSVQADVPHPKPSSLIGLRITSHSVHVRYMLQAYEDILPVLLLRVPMFEFLSGCASESSNIGELTYRHSRV